jgi:hypothetical protein
MPTLPRKSFAAPEGDREYTALLSYLPLDKWRGIEIYAVHLPDPASAGRFRRVDRILPARERTKPRVLDPVRVGRRGILAEVRPAEPPRQGDGGPAPGYGPDGVLPVQCGWVLDPAGLGRYQATYARTIDKTPVPDFRDSLTKRAPCGWANMRTGLQRLRRETFGHSVDHVPELRRVFVGVALQFRLEIGEADPIPIAYFVGVWVWVAV